MSKTKERVIARVAATGCPLDLLAGDGMESGHQTVWISRKTVCNRYGLRGVPTKRIDILVDQALESTDKTIVLEIVEKVGCYDESIRDRLTFRKPHPGMTKGLSAAKVEAAYDAEHWYIDVTVGDGTHIFSRTFDRLRSHMYDYNPQRLISWHWQRYFTHLSWDDVKGVVESFQIPERMTLAEANRLASRELYRLSRDLGWRKLTAREKRKLGLEGEPSWQMERKMAELYQATGCGEATHAAARGIAWEDDE